ncbi:hypothetical protein GOP47_0001088, partial [Adiantum capillus-veneris]
NVFHHQRSNKQPSLVSTTPLANYASSPALALSLLGRPSPSAAEREEEPANHTHNIHPTHTHTIQHPHAQRQQKRINARHSRTETCFFSSRGMSRLPGLSNLQSQTQEGIALAFFFDPFRIVLRSPVC